MRPVPHILLISLIASVACRQTYAPPIVAHPPDYLVVEGFIDNNSSDTTFFTLSHTIPLTDTSSYAPETSAKVTIEDSVGNSYKLTEIRSGVYFYPPFPFNNNGKYRLHIFTSSQVEYASDFVPLVSNPPIDSVSFTRTDKAIAPGVQISVTTHDPQNNTHYYRWNGEETWQFHVKYFANITYYNNALQLFDDTVYTCFKSAATTTIALGSSTQLSQDIIYEAPVTLIPVNSQQMQIKYSILVKQYALTKDAFNWWQVLQKNTENIGSIFGVQPSANPGNIHCLTDTTRQVLGYVAGGNIQSKRIFISNSQVQPWDFEDDCDDKLITYDQIPLFINRGYLLYKQVLPLYRVSHNYCVDCTLTGTLKTPSFWQ